MALKIHFKKKSQGVTWKSGSFYSFKYSAYQNDPEPTYLHLNSFSGFHPKTGRQWRFHQGINISYIPRRDRKRFVDVWRKEFEKSGNPKVTWDKIKTRYPYIQAGIRRYFYSPSYYIRNAREIPPEQWDREVVRSFAKDFSKTIRRKVAARLKGLFAGRRR